MSVAYFVMELSSCVEVDGVPLPQDLAADGSQYICTLLDSFSLTGPNGKSSFTNACLFLAAPNFASRILLLLLSLLFCSPLRLLCAGKHLSLVFPVLGMNLWDLLVSMRVELSMTVR